MKSMNYVLKLIFLLSLSQYVLGQPYFSKNYDYARSENTGWKIIELNQFYYGLSARSCSHPFGDCTLLNKFDRNGSLIWSLDFPGYNSRTIGNICTDGEHVFIATHFDFAYLKNITIFKISQDGTVADSISFGPFNKDHIARSLNYFKNELQLLVVYWHDHPNPGLDSSEIWVMDRNLRQTKTIHFAEKYFYEDYKSFEPTYDNQWIAAKAISNDFVTNYCRVIKMDSLGNKLWHTDLNNTEGFFVWQQITQCPDSGFVVNWERFKDFIRDTFPSTHTLTKLDKHGNILWERRFPKWDKKFIVNHFITNDGNILVYGTDKNVRYTKYNGAGLLMKLDQQGNVLWDRRIIHHTSSSGHLVFFSGMELQNGDLLLSGDVINMDSTKWSSQDFWLVALTKDGCYYDYCDTTMIISPRSTNLSPDIDKEVPPKFFSCNTLIQDKCKLVSHSYALSSLAESTLTMHDLQGQLVLKKRVYSFPHEIDFSAFQDGVYFIRLFDPQQRLIQCEKVVKMGE